MRNTLLLAMALAGSGASAQTRPATLATGGTCQTLMRSYDGASMDLAANEAAGIGDDSAPRATLRAMEDANTLAQARITLDLMRDNHCPLPKSAPDSTTYLSAALTCATDRLKQSGLGAPPSCDRTAWHKMAQ